MIVLVYVWEGFKRPPYKSHISPAHWSVSPSCNELNVYTKSCRKTKNCGGYSPGTVLNFQLIRSQALNGWHCARCSEKNTHSHFVFYLHGKCSDFHKNFGKCIRGNKYSAGIKARYSLLPVTSCCRQFSVLQTMGFTVEDISLIKCLRVSKGYGAASLCKMFSDNWILME